MGKSQKEIEEQFSKYVIANYTRLPVTLVRGRGSMVWDAAGKEYIDLFPGWGVAGLGHCHTAIAEAVAAQAQKLIHVANNYYIEEQGEFAQLLSERADGQQCFFCNSGAEAAEGAIKLARLQCQPKYKVITMEGSFHGRTFAAISATGQPAYRKGFEPTVPGFSHAKFNDIESVKALIDDETCAVMLEPVQGENGVYPADKEFLIALRKLCDDKGIMLIFDEVQTTPARLGEWFGYQYFGVQPDILTSAKAIAGGMPMGLIMARPEVAKSMIPGTHASTFGGNSIGCAAGIRAIKVIEEEGLLENVKTLSAYIGDRLAKIADSSAVVKSTRRTGFMIGIELNIEGKNIVDNCRDAGLLINCTHGTTLRMLPSFNISREVLDKGLDIIEKVIGSV